jgi:hypothetical protein
MLEEILDMGHLESFLIAYLPTKLHGYLTGNFSVDMILITMLVGIITKVLNFEVWLPLLSKNELQFKIDFYTNQHGDLLVNQYYKSMVWLISSLLQNKKQGQFLLEVNTDTISERNLLSLFTLKEKKGDPRLVTWIQSDPDLSDFSFRPVENQQVSFEYQGMNWTVTFIPFNLGKEWKGTVAPPLPSIAISQKNSKVSLAEIHDMVVKIHCLYTSKAESSENICRYEFRNNYWDSVKEMVPTSGLNSVCLSEENEMLLKRDLRTFKENEVLYSKLGIPYKRGFLLSGPPGTGKSSLIYALASELNRDLYYVNLGTFDYDEGLQNAFRDIPRNTIVVLEDIDASCSAVKSRVGGKKKGYRGITLPTLLNILDGSMLAHGMLFIMTSNHPEDLDPALIRPGRIDLHLKMDYATKYQLQNMYRNVMTFASADETYHGKELDLKEMEDRVIPPCEAMRLFLLYRDLDTLEMSKMIVQRYYQVIQEKRDLEKLQEEEEAERIARLEQRKQIVAALWEDSSAEDDIFAGLGW